MCALYWHCVCVIRGVGGGGGGGVSTCDLVCMFLPYLVWKCLLVFICCVRLYTTDLYHYRYLCTVCFSLSCEVLWLSKSTLWVPYYYFQVSSLLLDRHGNFCQHCSCVVVTDHWCVLGQSVYHQGSSMVEKQQSATSCFEDNWSISSFINPHCNLFWWHATGA